MSLLMDALKRAEANGTAGAQFAARRARPGRRTVPEPLIGDTGSTGAPIRCLTVAAHNRCRRRRSGRAAPNQPPPDHHANPGAAPDQSRRNRRRACRGAQCLLPSKCRSGTRPDRRPLWLALLGTLPISGQIGIAVMSGIRTECDEPGSGCHTPRRPQPPARPACRPAAVAPDPSPRPGQPLPARARSPRKFSTPRRSPPARPALARPGNADEPSGSPCSRPTPACAARSHRPASGEAGDLDGNYERFARDPKYRCPCWRWPPSPSARDAAADAEAAAPARPGRNPSDPGDPPPRRSGNRPEADAASRRKPPEEPARASRNRRHSLSPWATSMPARTAGARLQQVYFNAYSPMATTRTTCSTLAVSLITCPGQARRAALPPGAGKPAENQAFDRRRRETPQAELEPQPRRAFRPTAMTSPSPQPTSTGPDRQGHPRKTSCASPCWSR